MFQIIIHARTMQITLTLAQVVDQDVINGIAPNLDKKV